MCERVQRGRGGIVKGRKAGKRLTRRRPSKRWIVQEETECMLEKKEKKWQYRP